jgi:hypothetical protein
MPSRRPIPLRIVTVGFAAIALASLAAVTGCRSSASDAREKPGLDRIYFDINNDGIEEFVEIARGVDGGPDHISAVPTASNKLPPEVTKTLVPIPFKCGQLASLTKVVEGGVARAYLKVDSDGQSFTLYSSPMGLTVKQRPDAPAGDGTVQTPSAPGETPAETPADAPEETPAPAPAE